MRILQVPLQVRQHLTTSAVLPDVGDPTPEARHRTKGAVGHAIKATYSVAAATGLWLGELPPCPRGGWERMSTRHAAGARPERHTLSVISSGKSHAAMMLGHLWAGLESVCPWKFVFSSAESERPRGGHARHYP